MEQFMTDVKKNKSNDRWYILDLDSYVQEFMLHDETGTDGNITVAQCQCQKIQW